VADGVILDWSSNGPHGAAEYLTQPRQCTLCGQPCNLISPDKGLVCHKTCAENWYDQHPDVKPPVRVRNTRGAKTAQPSAETDRHDLFDH
jgi:hypothetical protein